ncbi:hypothetical protein FACS189462_0820 [Spirochaetia bacterium]|nr:hypothetical protein FACS189462_0820 [Spirochaetia bacterium]
MNQTYALIPQPVSVKQGEGFFQCLGIPVISGDSIFKNEIDTVSEQLRADRERCGCADNTGGAAGKIFCKKEDMKEDAYRLLITEAAVTVSAASGAGIYNGLQSLRQLFLGGRDGAVSIPCGEIEDRPRFGWRGLMLDCSRYFYSVEFIKKLIDTLSLHHINVFHWHLTDDQGWRLPIKEYPLLIEIGSKRREHRLSGRFSGGFYTEDDIRSVVAFAAARHVEVVPEVDLPGHASAILAAYPGLGCTGGPYRVEDRFGIFEDVLCAGNDGIFDLAAAAFDTLARLFPSPYVHIGGDEVRFNNWNECPKCKKRLAETGLKDARELQSWITVRLVKMLAERGKTAIGWDEVLEDTEQYKLPLDVVVQSWRGSEGGIKASGLGHRVIMSSKEDGCYLDYRHTPDPEEPGQRWGKSTVFQGYAMDPVTQEMTPEQTALVLGGQGNLWSELIYAGKIAEYMIFPRICAIAESLWTAKEAKNFEDFKRRLPIHQERLDRLGILQYRGNLEG